MCYLGTSMCAWGLRSEADDEWWDERGPYGHGVLNSAGRELLSSCSLNGATVCNTWFQREGNPQTDLAAPKSKQWHCIDYAIMRRAQSWKYLDVVLKRGAACNTDQLVKLKHGKKFYRQGSKDRLVKRFDVTKLCDHARMQEGTELLKGKFVSSVLERLSRCWAEADSVQKKCKAMKNVMCEVGKSVLGQTRRRETDWFRESEDILRPLFEARSSSFTQWLSYEKERDRKKFVVTRRVARKAVREVKNKWFQAKVAKASASRNGSGLYGL